MSTDLSAGLCYNSPTPDLWYPDGIPNSVRDPYGSAREICLACPLILECLEAALAEETGAMRFGMRGAKTPLERHRLVANRQQQARRAGAA